LTSIKPAHRFTRMRTGARGPATGAIGGRRRRTLAILIAVKSRLGHAPRA
jgi:hypothetical protein